MSTWVDFTKPLFAKQKVAGTQRSVKNLPFSFTKIISLWNWLISSNNYFEICGPFAKHRPEKKLLISFPQKSFEKMLVKSPPCASMFLSKTRQIFRRQLFSRQHFGSTNFLSSKWKFSQRKCSWQRPKHLKSLIVFIAAKLDRLLLFLTKSVGDRHKIGSHNNGVLRVTLLVKCVFC